MPRFLGWRPPQTKEKPPSSNNPTPKETNMVGLCRGLKVSTQTSATKSRTPPNFRMYVGCTLLPPKPCRTMSRFRSSQSRRAPSRLLERTNKKAAEAPSQRQGSSLGLNMVPKWGRGIFRVFSKNIVLYYLNKKKTPHTHMGAATLEWVGCLWIPRIFIKTRLTKKGMALCPGSAGMLNPSQMPQDFKTVKFIPGVNVVYICMHIYVPRASNDNSFFGWFETFDYKPHKNMENT